MTRRPGYDIDGQPTKVDPRDFPDPLRPWPMPEDFDAMTPAEFDAYVRDSGLEADIKAALAERHKPRRGDWGCSVFALAAILLALLAGCSAQPAGHATPQSQKGGDPTDPAHRLRVSVTQPAVASAASEQPMTLAQAPLPTMPAEPAGNGLGVRSGGLASTPAPPLTPEVLAGGTTYSGRLAWADPKYGPRYLALREPRGTLVEVCGPSGCVQRRSTDFGPVRSLWLAGRIADVSAADFLEICGVPLSFGLCPGSVQILSRPRFELPATSTEEGE